jgi:hypothetical protein
MVPALGPVHPLTGEHFIPSLGRTVTGPAHFRKVQRQMGTQDVRPRDLADLGPPSGWK